MGVGPPLPLTTVSVRLSRPTPTQFGLLCPVRGTGLPELLKGRGGLSLHLDGLPEPLRFNYRRPPIWNFGATTLLIAQK